MKAAQELAEKRGHELRRLQAAAQASGCGWVWVGVGGGGGSGG